MVSLTRQLIALLIIFICLTALLIASVSYYLADKALETQVQARLELGVQLTQTMWQAMDLQIQQTVASFVQRPTLLNLLQDTSRTELEVYLNTFQNTTNLDFLYVLDSDAAHFSGDLPSENKQAYRWQQLTESGYTLVAGIYIDSDLLSTFGQETDFVYWLPSLRPIPNDFRAASIQLAAGVDVVMLLSIADVASSRQSLLLIIVAITSLTVALASIFGGVYIHKQINPLWRLRAAAKRMGDGDLSTPIISVGTFTPDISTLRDTLESSRQHIAQSLKLTQEQLDWTSALMQSIVEGIVTYNRDGQIVFHSDSTAQIMHWRKPKVGRQLDNVFICQEDGSVFSQIVPTEGRYKAIDLVLEDEQRITVLVTRARTLPSGETSLVVRDVTEENRKRNAQAYYLANLSHEFRTPLSGMKASLELLFENFGGLSKQEEAQLLNSIVLSVSNLQSLIDNLLEGSKLEAQQFTLRVRKVWLDDILIDSIRMMQPFLTRRQQSLHITETHTPLILSADKTRMVQVFVNLLSNASKYSPQGKGIEILIETRAEKLWIGVADRGAGIPEGQRDQLFRQFVRLEQSADVDHSTGLGLAVVRGIVEAHGGQVGVLPREGGGSVFWLELPIEMQS